jgi:hypothetical protein
MSADRFEEEKFKLKSCKIHGEMKAFATVMGGELCDQGIEEGVVDGSGVFG